MWSQPHAGSADMRAAVTTWLQPHAFQVTAARRSAGAQRPAWPRSACPAPQYPRHARSILPSYSPRNIDQGGIPAMRDYGVLMAPSRSHASLMLSWLPHARPVPAAHADALRLRGARGPGRPGRQGAPWRTGRTSSSESTTTRRWCGAVETRASDAPPAAGRRPPAAGNRVGGRGWSAGRPLSERRGDSARGVCARTERVPRAGATRRPGMSGRSARDLSELWTGRR